MKMTALELARLIRANQYDQDTKVEFIINLPDEKRTIELKPKAWEHNAGSNTLTITMEPA